MEIEEQNWQEVLHNMDYENWSFIADTFMDVINEAIKENNKKLAIQTKYLLFTFGLTNIDYWRKFKKEYKG